MSKRRRREAGDTLVEILVALAVLSIGVVALVGALGANAFTTAINRSQSEAATVATAAAEYVKSVPLTSALCASAMPFDAAAVPRPTGFAVSFGPLAGYAGYGCAELASVTLTVTGDGFTVPVTVVKRA